MEIKKKINNALSMALLCSLGAILYLSYSLYSSIYLFNIEASLHEQEKRIEYINNSTNIDKLKEFSFVFVKSETKHVTAYKELLESVAYFSFLILMFSIYITYQLYITRKSLLTSSSSGTTKQQVAP